MADTKVTALSELTIPVRDDILYVVDDPSGTPIQKKAQIKNIVAALDILQVLGSLSANTNISVAAGNVVSLTIGAALTLGFTNPPTSGTLGMLILVITNGDAYTITWPSSVAWGKNGIPALQTSGVDVLGFITIDGGTTWRAMTSWQEA